MSALEHSTASNASLVITEHHLGALFGIVFIEGMAYHTPSFTPSLITFGSSLGTLHKTYRTMFVLNWLAQLRRLDNFRQYP